MFPGFAGGHAEGGAAHSVHRGAARVREDPREAAGDREAEQRAHEARVRLGEETSLRTSQQGDAGVKQDLFPILSSSETDILKGKNFNNLRQSTGASCFSRHYDFKRSFFMLQKWIRKHSLKSALFSCMRGWAWTGLRTSRRADSSPAPRRSLPPRLPISARWTFPY